MKHIGNRFTIIKIAAAAALMAASSCKQSTADATGIFEAQTITLSSEVSGRVLALSVKEGDTVTKGQPIALIDTTQLDLQRQQLKAAIAALETSRISGRGQTEAIDVQLAQLERDLLRTNNLLNAGAATRQQKEQIETQIAALKGQKEAQNETIGNTNSSIAGETKVKEIQIKTLGDMIARCHISAPASGNVSSLYMAEGELAAAGHPIAKIVDLDNVWLLAYFPGSKMASIKEGQKVKVRTLYGADEEREYEGTITSIASEAQFTPKTIPTNDERSNMVYAVKISIRNDGYVRTGLSGEVYMDR